MARFFIQAEDICGQIVTIREDVHHILHVLRYKEGDTLEVCDRQGTDYQVKLLETHENTIRCEILHRENSSSEPEIQITLFQGMPKSDKMEWILQKGVELGIAAFVPLRTSRCVVKYDAKKEAQKTVRWQKIVESAAKQSGRGCIPIVYSSIAMDECCRQLALYDQVLVFYENAREVSLKAYLNKQVTRPERIAICIGPEGGWESSEIQLLEEAGAVTVGLGPRILRTETAGMTAAALILYHFDQM